LTADLARAGIGVISLPLTDLYLMGRGDERNVRRGLTPIRRLLEAASGRAGHPTISRNRITRSATADPTILTFVGAVAATWGPPTSCASSWPRHDVSARILNLRDYGCAAGCRADLVVWECERERRPRAAGGSGVRPRRTFRSSPRPIR